MLSVYELSSPNGQLVLTVENGRVLQYSLSLKVGLSFIPLLFV